MNTIFSVKDKVIAITGATGYLGSKMAEQLSSAGAKVMILSTSLEKAQALCDRLGLSHLHAFSIDLEDKASIEKAFARIVETFSTIDVLVNNAYFGIHRNFYSNSDADWHKALDGSVISVDHCVQAVIPYMKAQTSGRIINISSMYGMTVPYPEVYNTPDAMNPLTYGVGKAAINQYTKYAAMMLAEYGITVNSVSYGPFPNPDNVTDETFLENLRAKTLVKRIGTAEDVGSAIFFLSLDESGYVTGQNIVVDGGWTV